MAPRSLLIVGILFVSAFAFTACKDKDEPTVPYGPLSATGTLIPAENSLTRRGSHMLVIDGIPEYFVESRTQNLREVEGFIVSATGILEPNTSKNDLPVLVAVSVKRSLGDEDLHRFEIPALNLRLGIPDTWGGAIKDGVALFMLRGEESPILSIRLMSGSSLPPGGTPIFIKNRRGTKIGQDAGSTEIYVLEKGTVIHMHFDPASQEQVQTAEEGAVLAAQFERILGSISFISDKDVPRVTTGTGAGMPCGGPAGVLCPSGYFCNVTDPVERIGQCKAR